MEAGDSAAEATGLLQKTPAGAAGDGPAGAAAKPGLMQRLKSMAKRLKAEALALYYALHDPRCPLLAKILPFLAVAYALSPIDLIPDFIPVLGYLDDLLLLPLLMWAAIKLIPAEVMERARRRAATEPLYLDKNWCAAVFIFLSWLASLEILLWTILMAIFLPDDDDDDDDDDDEHDVTDHSSHDDAHDNDHGGALAPPPHAAPPLPNITGMIYDAGNATAAGFGHLNVTGDGASGDDALDGYVPEARCDALLGITVAMFVVGTLCSLLFAWWLVRKMAKSRAKREAAELKAKQEGAAGANGAVECVRLMQATSTAAELAADSASVGAAGAVAEAPQRQGSLEYGRLLRQEPSDAPPSAGQS